MSAHHFSHDPDVRPEKNPATPGAEGGDLPSDAWISTRSVLFRGNKFDFEQVSIQSRTGQRLERQVVRHPGAVVILPVLEASGFPTRLVMIRNVRVSLERDLLELPAGTLERGEDPAACAARELIEETGYQAATIMPLARFYTTPGLTDEFMHAFLARGLTPVGQDLEDDESITVCPMDLEAVLGLIDRGELVDGKSVLSILSAIRQGLLSVRPDSGHRVFPTGGIHG